jgi:predicted acylesterase/phospholipase RssA/CRP-like cAMP-binding protein
LRPHDSIYGFAEDEVNNGDDVNNSDERTAPPTRERLHVDLRRHEWAKGLSEETLAAITNTSEWVQFHTDEVVVDVESEITHVYFLITGRVQATLHDRLGKEIQKDTFVPGFAIALLALGSSDRSLLHAVALEPSTAIRLTPSDMFRLAANHADFQRMLFRLAVNAFKRYAMADRSFPKPSVVGIIHHTEASRPLAGRLARRLRDLDESPCIAGDDEQWKPDGDIPFRLLVGEGNVRQDFLKGWASSRRLLVDVRADHSPEAMARLLSYADILLWCVRPQDTAAAVLVLQELEKSVPRWRDKIRIVWVLDHNAPIAPYVPGLYELAERDFKLAFDAPGANQNSLLQHGFERIVHHLRGIQIGLALGGGAARGMAHLGVFKALEQHGIYINMISGTSAGAMTGALYAAGLDPEYIAHCFKTDLQPSWLFRRLPGGGYWYLLYKYRRRQFDPMLRKYLGRTRMEQLILPMFTISVDLVEGEPVVREAGDATTDVLESINLPPLSLPIFGAGQALVDGGLLNNVPANVLVARGCNFVIASTVTAKLEKDFAGIRSKGHSLSGRAVSTLQVIMRQNMIQNRNMNAVGVQPADFVVAPDVTSFDISEFTRVDEMARIGEATTNATVAHLRKMLSRLDSKLFESSRLPPVAAAPPKAA